MDTYDLEIVFAGAGAVDGYTITVADAVSGRVLPSGSTPASEGASVVSAGSGNVVSAGSGNVVSAGALNYRRVLAETDALRTDASGHMRLMLAGVQPGDVLRFMATKGDQRLEAWHLVQTEAKTVQQVTAIRLVLSPITTTGVRVLTGILQLSRLLKPRLREGLMLEAIGGFNKLSPALEAQLTEKPHVALELTLDPERFGQSARSTAALRTALHQSGATQAMTDLLVESVRKIANLVQDAVNRSTDTALPGQVVLAGTDFVVEIVSEQALNIRNVITGIAVPADQADGKPVESPGVGTGQVPTVVDVTLQ